MMFVFGSVCLLMFICVWQAAGSSRTGGRPAWEQASTSQQASSLDSATAESRGRSVRTLKLCGSEDEHIRYHKHLVLLLETLDVGLMWRLLSKNLIILVSRHEGPAPPEGSLFRRSLNEKKSNTLISLSVSTASYFTLMCKTVLSCCSSSQPVSVHVSDILKETLTHQHFKLIALVCLQPANQHIINRWQICASWRVVVGCTFVMWP